MEITRQDSIRLYHRQIVVNLRLPAFAWLVLAILISNLMLVVGVTAIARNMTPPQHPFTNSAQPIADLMLDQAVRHLYTCRDDDGASWSRDARYSYYSQSQHCTYSPVTGTFSRIQFAFSGDRIRGVSIHVRGNTLTIGDLVLVWGMPVRRVNGHLVYLRWPGRSVTAFTRTGRFSYLLPVYHIWLTEDCGTSFCLLSHGGTAV